MLRIKRLPLLVAAVAAACLLVSPSLAAASFTSFEHEGGKSYPFTFEAQQKTNHVIKVGSLRVECTKALFKGTIPSATSQLKVTPTYEGCSGSVEGIATMGVEKSGCQLFNFHNTENVTIEEGCSLVVKAAGGKCEVVIKGNGVKLNKATYTDVEKPFGLEINSQIEGLPYEVVKSLNCGIEKAKGTGEYKGSSFAAGLNTNEFGFDAEAGWFAEGKGGDIQITEDAEVLCAKEKYEGVSPVQGFSNKADMAPNLQECTLQIKKAENPENNESKTPAKFASRGCDYETLAEEEPGKDDFTTEFDISNCSGAGILISDSEMGTGKTCEILIPDQQLGREFEDKDLTGEKFESEAKVDATDVTDEVKGCPESIESGKEPKSDKRVIIYVPVYLEMGLKSFRY